MSSLNRQGITAVEVMVSTLLASLLMVAMLSVLRGLRVQAEALETRIPRPAWQTTLDTVLQHDLENSRTYQLTGSAIILHGNAGRDPVTQTPTWKPSKIVYEIVPSENRTWLVRHETVTKRRELVLADVSVLRIGGQLTSQVTTVTTNSAEKLPITAGLTIEFWDSSAGGPRYAYRFRKP